MDDAEQFLKIATLYGGKGGPPSAKFRAWLQSLGLSNAATSLVTAHNLKRASGAGAVDFYSEKDVVSINADDGIPVCIRDGLLIVGRCPNGDSLVVDIRDQIGAAGYVGHETMWDVESVRNIFVVLAPSLGQVAQGLHEGQMPMDYDEAIESRSGRA